MNTNIDNEASNSVYLNAVHFYDFLFDSMTEEEYLEYMKAKYNY